MSLSDAERAKALVENPNRYNEFIGNYSSEFKYYNDVRNAAPHELNSFEEYLELHRVFFEKTSDEGIKSTVEERLPRSVKNMVLGFSLRGKAYSLDTLMEIQLRYDAYGNLGISTPTLYQQSQTIIEALYDVDWAEGYRVVDNLLNDYPDNALDTVELLARLRVVLGIYKSETPLQVLQSEVKRWVQITKIPLDDPPKTAQDCIDEALTLRYNESRKADLYATAVHRDATRTDAFLEYLYLTARDIIEQYRHGSESPARAMLGVSELQLVQLHEHDDFPLLAYRERKRKEWCAWVDSYIAVAEGILHSEGRFYSSRENWPSTDFSKAAQAYLHASKCVQNYHPIRHAKYVSKAFRHAENAVQNWESGQILHDYATIYLINLSGEDECNGGDYQTQLQSCIRYHRFKRTELAISIHFRENEYQKVIESYYDYLDLMENLHQPKESFANSEIENKYQLSEARIAEMTGDYENAINYFEYLIHIENKPNNIEKRAALCRLKQYVASDRLDDAIEVAETYFRQDQLAILSAMKLLHGDGTVEIPDSYDSLFLHVISDRTDSIRQLVALNTVSAESNDSGLIEFLREEVLRL